MVSEGNYVQLVIVHNNFCTVKESFVGLENEKEEDLEIERVLLTRQRAHRT